MFVSWRNVDLIFKFFYSVRSKKNIKYDIIYLIKVILINLFSFYEIFINYKKIELKSC